MVAITPLVADRFCDLCFRAYQAWQTLAGLATHAAHTASASTLGPAASRAFVRLYEAISDQAILHIVRLHDPAVVAGKVTLTLDYVVKYGGWDPQLGAELDALRKQLDSLLGERTEGLRRVRNQTLAHNDMAALLANEPVRLFTSGEEDGYFKTLEMFASAVSDAAKGTGYRFTGTAKRDGEALARALGPQVP